MKKNPHLSSKYLSPRSLRAEFSTAASHFHQCWDHCLAVPSPWLNILSPPTQAVPTPAMKTRPSCLKWGTHNLWPCNMWGLIWQSTSKYCVHHQVQVLSLTQTLHTPWAWRHSLVGSPSPLVTQMGIASCAYFKIPLMWIRSTISEAYFLVQLVLNLLPFSVITRTSQWDTTQEPRETSTTLLHSTKWQVHPHTPVWNFAGGKNQAVPPSSAPPSHTVKHDSSAYGSYYGMHMHHGLWSGPSLFFSYTCTHTPMHTQGSCRLLI